MKELVEIDRYELALELACHGLDIDVGDNYYDENGINRKSNWKERFLKEADKQLSNK